MKTRLLLCGILAIISFLPVSAQFKCAFDDLLKDMRTQHAGYEEELNRKVQEYIRLNPANVSRTAAAPYYIPVVVHVIHTGGAVGTTYNPTDATIQGAIDYLNDVYNGTWTGSGGAIMGVGDLQIQFVLATKDPDGNVSTGINRINGTVLTDYSTMGVGLSGGTPTDLSVKNLVRWDPTRYYNIWVVNRIDGADGTVPGVAFTAGYAYFPMPNYTTNQNLMRDGTVMLASQFAPGRKTLPHEIGHAFNLYHVFEGEGIVGGGLNTCPSNSDPTKDGDACSDTDPVINPADDGYGVSAFGCRTGVNSCNGAMYNDNTEKNFMNYTMCYQVFTSEQKIRMHAAAEITMRNSLATSWANNQGGYPTTWSAPAVADVAPVTGGSYSNYLGITYVKLNNMSIHSLNATQDGGYKDNAKWYNLFELSPNTNYTMEVGLKSSNNQEQLGVWIDYDGDGSFNDAEERVYYQTGLTHASSSPLTDAYTINFTTPSSLPGNIVRMRVMNDFATIYGTPALTGSIANLVGGQAEDYAVFLKNTSILPVKITEFRGQMQDKNAVLNWNTSNESNAKEYQVERSGNGSVFTTAGIVIASGNSNSEQRYSFTDMNLPAGKYYYRLKMVDQDHSYKYSNTIQLNVVRNGNVIVMGNPFTNEIRVMVKDVTGLMSLILSDANGKQVLNSTTNVSTPGMVTVPVNKELTKGVYILEIIINNERIVHKMIKE